MARTKHTEGFTIAELLTVVAILAVLAALVGVSLFNYMRSLTLTEYDNAAKSIYIAAQNNIADLQASGEWAANEGPSASSGNTTTGNTTTSYYTQHRITGDTEASGCYYVTAPEAQQNGILPAGTIEAEVWSHSYVIEYNYETATVYGVFYTEGTQAELNTYYADGAGSRDRDTRRDHNPQIGYYGGSDASTLTRITLEDPLVSAGRSSTLAVTDNNLVNGNSSRSEIRTLVTITNQTRTGEGTSISLVLSSSSSVTSAVFYEPANGGAPILFTDSTFCSLPGTQGSTYSLNLIDLKNNTQAAPFMANFQPGDEYQVVAKSINTAHLSRPAYGYGTGIWPNADEVVFTSNLLADYETTLSDAAGSTDLYVYRSGSDPNRTESFSFNLENWYNNATYANENLRYRLVSAGGLQVESVMTASNTPVSSPLGLYSYPFVAGASGPEQNPHTVTCYVNMDSLGADNIASLQVQVYREAAIIGEVIPGTPAKTLTINVHVLSAQSAFAWRVDDHGSYCDVVLLAGENNVSGINILCNAPAVLDRSNSHVTALNGSRAQVNNLAAGGSLSVRFLKTDTNYSLTSSSFSVTPTA